jgi:hypothetical protein
MNDAVIFVGTAICRGALAGAQCYQPDAMQALGYNAIVLLVVVLLSARVLARL